MHRYTIPFPTDKVYKINIQLYRAYAYKIYTNKSSIKLCSAIINQ